MIAYLIHKCKNTFINNLQHYVSLKSFKIHYLIINIHMRAVERKKGKIRENYDSDEKPRAQYQRKIEDAEKERQTEIIREK